MKESLDPEFANVCSVIGTITITWGWADLLLSLAIGILFESLPAIKGHPDIPRSMDKRLHYLKCALKTDALAPLQQEGSLVAKEFARLKETRNEIIHRAAWKTGKGQFDSLRLDIKGRKQTAVYEGFDLNVATAFGMEVVGLVDISHAFLFKLVEIFPKPPAR